MKDVGLFMHGAVFSNRVLGFINAPALMQRLVTDLQDANVDVEAYRRKRDLFYNKLTDLGFECVKPEGAFYLFPKVPIADEMEFVRKAQEYRILIVPGSGFGGPGYFRIAYCTDEKTIERSFPLWEQLATELGLTKN
jgi:aspartate aminotransferase